MTHFQIDTSRDGANFIAANSDNPGNPQAAIDRARGIITWVDQQGVPVGDLRRGWNDITDRPGAAGEAGLAAQASQLLAFAVSKKAEAEAGIKARYDAWILRESNVMAARATTAGRAAWAETYCKAYWAIGAAAACLAARVAETARPIYSGSTTSAMSDTPWVAPVASHDELSAALEVLEADLAALTAAAATARAALKVA